MICRNNERFNGVIQFQGITEFLPDKKIEKVAEGKSENDMDTFDKHENIKCNDEDVKQNLSQMLHEIQYDIYGRSCVI
jgi:hypothetical protein